MHRAVVTAAAVHDKQLLDDGPDGEERLFYGNSAYAIQKVRIGEQAPHAHDLSNQRTRRYAEIDEAERARNRNKSRILGRVERVFGVLKRLSGFNKAGYRGLDRNANRRFLALVLANWYLAHGRLAG